MPLLIFDSYNFLKNFLFNGFESLYLGIKVQFKLVLIVFEFDLGICTLSGCIYLLRDILAPVTYKICTKL